jgi:AmmeMemoRadiSam system protein A
VERGENLLCGGGPILAAIAYAQKSGSADVEILKYADSAEAGGPPDKVVGYLAAAIRTKIPGRGFSLDAKEKNELLRVARESVNAAVRGKAPLDAETTDPKLREARGAFVTLTRSGRLRGCIGFIEPVLPLIQTVARCASLAAIRDPRFDPVAPSELPDLSYEISVLTPLQKITDPALVQVGRHGLVISFGENRGLLLPQVATENHWSREEFLAQTCLKAGLPRDAWKKGAEISVFQAIVFR